MLRPTNDKQSAGRVPLVDAGGYYTGTDVEAALQEVGVHITNTTIHYTVGSIDHGLVDGPSLLDDDHPGYPWGLGRAGGQTLIGSPTTAEILTLKGSSGVDPGFVDIGSPTRITGHLEFSSYLQANVTTVTTTSHTAGEEHVILVDDDTAGSTVTVTLPAASTREGLIYHIKKMGSTAAVVIDGNLSETIDGTITQTLAAQYDSAMLVCDGTNWSII